MARKTKTTTPITTSAPAAVEPIAPVPIPVGADPGTAVPAPAPTRPRRERLPATRRSLTHKFNIVGHEGYITVGLYPDGRPGELFITMAKEGSTVGGLTDCIGILTSIALQSGVDLETLVRKLDYTAFAPAGPTKTASIPWAASLVDYIFRRLGITFVPTYMEEQLAHSAAISQPAAPNSAVAVNPQPGMDGPPCATCGCATSRVGTCYLCHRCGTSGGCS